MNTQHSYRGAHGQVWRPYAAELASPAGAITVRVLATSRLHAAQLVDTLKATVRLAAGARKP